MEHIWMCSVCDMRDMVERHAFMHAERTYHRVRYQTPEDRLEREATPQPRLSPEHLRAVINHVDTRFADFIIDGTTEREHSNECRCFNCQRSFIDKLGGSHA